MAGSVFLSVLVLLTAHMAIIRGKSLRKSVDDLTDEEILNLRVAFSKVQADDGAEGFQKLAAYHGAPAGCSMENGQKIACCIHGMPVFPHWHRLYVTQIEQSLVKHGASIGVPYWDWSKQLSALPEIVREPLFINPTEGKAQKNPFYEGQIASENAHTARAVDDHLFDQQAPGHFSPLMEGILLALEQEDYCDFEVQFEVAHNAIHYMVGGPYKYGMSTLDYTSYDPIFYLHHSMVDRIFAIWQALQKERHLPADRSNCALQDMKRPMRPFNFDSNPSALTKSHSVPDQLWDTDALGYEYDSLELNGMDIPELNKLLRDRREESRVFAAFRLNGIGTSADVKIYVCVPSGDDKREDDCSHYAGRFFILGGSIEMPWSFDRLYLQDITKTIDDLHLAYDGNYYIDLRISAVNGTSIPTNSLRNPHVVYKPAKQFFDPAPPKGDRSTLAVRKDISRLTQKEVFHLREAMGRFAKDKSVSGFEATAEYHGLPARCPRPDAKDRFACCIHGMATFVHWHRLYVVQVEDAIKRRGSGIGVPYWDWTKPMTELPALAGEATYVNPWNQNRLPNPFYKGHIPFVGSETARDVQDGLFEQPEFGEHTTLYEEVLYALEQDNFCDFAVQFEICHNRIHALVGGHENYSMSSLHFTSYDPIFFLHHSNVDRLWAIWQKLQIIRKKPYKAHCANSYVHRSLKPFAFSAPLNSNPKTYAHAVPTHIYDYENELGYTFDTLEYGGMTMEQLQIYLEKKQESDRVFAGFQLQGIRTSALVDFQICKADGTCGKSAGLFAVLGGPFEMNWRYDRPYKYEITKALHAAGLTKDDVFSIHLDITDVSGTKLDSHLIPEPSVIFEPGKVDHEAHKDWVIVRKDVNRLTPEETTALRVALGRVQGDSSAEGFQTIAGYHGIPTICPSPDAAVKFSCCVHGMATFAHWHRLYTVQFENALRKQGYTGALPYWDWATPLKSLPALATDATFKDPATGADNPNPWLKATITAGAVDTERDPSENLFVQPGFGKFTSLGKQLLFSFEQEDFCDFAVQFEVTHNAIHALVGGNKPYSMASLRYTTFDPIFFLHHSSVDRYWAIWQALQKFRGKPYNKANCALEQMRGTLMPFNLGSDVNPDDVTRANAAPFRVFDYENVFGYRYDNLEFNGLSISELSHEIESHQSEDRVFAQFMLHGIGKSALVKFYICLSESDCDHYAGEFYILGDTAEMPWRYDRTYKYEITSQLKALNVHFGDNFFIRDDITDLNGDKIPSETFPKPTVSYLPAHGTYGAQEEWVEPVTGASRIRKDLSTLTVGETESLRNAFLRLQKDKNKGYEYIAGFHGLPAKCPSPDNPKYACCLHGMPVFPHWHRLYILQVENALLNIGSSVSIPYWDWTKRIDKLPSLVNEATFYNSRTLRLDPNPFFRGDITFENAVTSRDPQPELFNNDYLYNNILLAFEEEDFCSFEVQFEVTHNAIHAWVGGRDPYSLSTLDYTAYDPIFFLHHSNVDRLWAVWQELQRYRKKPSNTAFCALPLMQTPIKPFSFDRSINPDWMTRVYSRPSEAFDYQNNFRYKYDTLEFNGMSIPKLQSLLEAQKAHDRVFAGFLLSGIQTSANVRIYICVPRDGFNDCSHYAGIFSVLGGEKEMPWSFDRLYKYDITPALTDLALTADSNFDVTIEVIARNGSTLSSDLFPRPTIIYQPGTGHATHSDSHANGHMVERKRISSLTPGEISSLMSAFTGLMTDSSPDGFQALASFHAIPPLCPSPAASSRFACCIHGMATFPQWHRIYVVQLEDALRRHGSDVGMPYWDWTDPMTALPHIFTDDEYSDARHQKHNNPLKNVDIAFEDAHVERDVVGDNLFEQPQNGKHTWLYDQVMLALEETNYCDFEVQLEVAHNAIHAWVGGSKEHSLGHLHYAAYDPIFFFHHSNLDRIWAVWQELQQYRGLSGSEANCALELMKEPLKPFSFGSPWNLNPLTKKFSKPADTFDYQNHFHYKYEHLEIGGMNVPQLDRHLREKQEHDRVFAGFLLHGFRSSASVTFQVCDPKGKCTDAGHFNILGGEMEMKWAFDRLYKYDITSAVEDLGARKDDALTISVNIVALNGTNVPASFLKQHTVFFVPGKDTIKHAHTPPNRVRKNVKNISEREIRSISAALTQLKEDESADGFYSIAAFHGSPAKCAKASGDKVACCIHGMASFPHWHRLYTVQFEDALRRHGSSVAVPYWDWTLDAHLPKLATRSNYYDAWRDTVVENPFLRGRIEHEKTYTARNVQPELTEVGPNGKNALYESMLLAFEQDDYCDFEVQFEVTHNAIHYLVGGRHEFALSSLSYTAYDPIFFLHHAQVDRLWAIWQALQKHRKQPYNKAYCAAEQMNEPMKPFSFDHTFNLNANTRSHSKPSSVFKYESLGYTYDDLHFDGHSIEELAVIVERRKHNDRVFANFLLHGIGVSADVHFSVCKPDNTCEKAGLFFVLGSDLEMPWAFDRTFKYDITPALKKLGVSLQEDLFHLQLSITAVNGTALSADVLPAPTLTFEPAGASHRKTEADHTAAPGIRKNVNELSSSEIDNLRDALRKVQADHSSHGYQAIAAYHGVPAKCRTPDGSDTMACCLHGMANFPHWHRLFTKQMEDALALKGARLGMPYWDWTQPFKSLPYLVTETQNNPFHQGHIVFKNTHTTRDPVSNLFNDPEFGEVSFFYRQVLYALEQRDFCDFEIQFEVSHNAIHSWVGGSSPYSMSTLHYTAYDPLFYLHHSNTDRIWAIWQALQKYRGLPYKYANCAIPLLRKPMQPFSRDSNWNDVTRTNSRPIDVFDYHRLGYQYDNLRFGDMDIPHLEHLLEENREKDRVFAGFLLSGFQASADVTFDVCLPSGKCKFAGTFAVLGGKKEMPWAFDRLFKYEITEALLALRADHHTVFSLEVKITATNKTQLSSDLIPRPTVIYEPGTAKVSEKHSTGPRSTALLRKELSTLTLEETKNLREAMNKLMNDDGPDGFETIASFHGAPGKCPEGATENTFSCCIHGMPQFPHWHRLFVVQAEKALQDHGATTGIPYWDWTRAMTALPNFVSQSDNNPWYHGYIKSENTYTTRTVDQRLFDPPQVSGHNFLHHNVLLSLEENDYCDFEVQFEIFHNTIHAWVGGADQHSLSTLEYSAFDPLFLIHHSNMDRLFIIWQELQKLRGKPYNSAPCAGRVMSHPMQPFNFNSLNTNSLTKEHSRPISAFDHHHLDYEYDSLHLNDKSISELLDYIKEIKRYERFFIGFNTHGLSASANVDFFVCHRGDSECNNYGGSFSVLGGPTEMPWAFERPFKYEVTDVFKKLGYKYTDDIRTRVEVKYPNGSALNADFPDAIVVYRPAESDNDVYSIAVGQGRHTANKIVAKRGTRFIFNPFETAGEGRHYLIDLSTYTPFFRCDVPEFGFQKYDFNHEYSPEPGTYYLTAADSRTCKSGAKFILEIAE